MEYKVIESSSPNELTKRVNELIQEGWVPIGSHQVVIRRQIKRYSGTQHKDTLNEIEYTQTLTKQNENESN